MTFIDEFGNEIELPTFTLELQKRFEEASQGGNSESLLKKRYQLLNDVLGSDYVAENIGDKFENIDITKLVLLFNLVRNTYNRPIIESQIKEITEMLSAIAPALEQLEKLKNTDLTPSRQGFNRVK